MTQTAHSDFGKISKIILKHAGDAFFSQEKIDKEWQKLNYLDKPDFQKSKDEYDTFVKHIKTVVDEVLFLPLNSTLSMDSIYVRDAMITTNKGVILCNMGKAERADEPKVASEFLKENDIPILGTIKGEGSVEGGDMVWLDEQTLVIGEGYRTNVEGIRQVRELTKDFVENIIVVPLVHYLGESDVFHLMSFISPIDSDLAVVYSKLMPVPFRQYLIERGMKFIEVPDDEFLTMGCNVLALAPRKALMLSGNPITQARLENAGVEVLVYEGEEISKKGCGGPTCLTRPLVRG